MPRLDLTSPSIFWTWVIAACIVSAPLCLFVAVEAVLVLMYGIEVLWAGVPESINRGPGDGMMFGLLALPVGFFLWLGAVSLIFVSTRRRHDRMIASRSRVNAA
jgi:hypothetical protein